MSNITLPSISSQGSLQKYLISIRKFPILEMEEEYTLAKMWKSKKMKPFFIEIPNDMINLRDELVAEFNMNC